MWQHPLVIVGTIQYLLIFWLILTNISGGMIQIIILMRGAFAALGERWHSSFVVKQNVKRSTLPVSAPISAPLFCLCFNCLDCNIFWISNFFCHLVIVLCLSLILKSSMLIQSPNVFFLFSDGEMMLKVMVRPLVRGVRGVVMWEAEV